MVFNVQKNVAIPAKFFQFNEGEIRRRQQDAKNPG